MSSSRRSILSPKHSQIAERLKTGLEAMVADGSLEVLVNRHFQDDLLKADLGRRTILRLENPFLPPGTPLKEKRLWLDIVAD